MQGFEQGSRVAYREVFLAEFALELLAEPKFFLRSFNNNIGKSMQNNGKAFRQQ